MENLRFGPNWQSLGTLVLLTTAPWAPLTSRSHNSTRQTHMMTGTIKTLRSEKGFGFIKDSSGKEFFCHQSAIFGEGIENLREGDSVEFELGPAGPKGPR